eukprot:11018310-Alexandrium_andersonii.AAC.1
MCQTLSAPWSPHSLHPTQLLPPAPHHHNHRNPPPIHNHAKRSRGAPATHGQMDITPACPARVEGRAWKPTTCNA